MSKIKVAIIGVGNCASALVQGVYYYKQRAGEEPVGVVFPEIGGYKVTDIDFVVAFDVDEHKVNKDLSEAIFAPPNNALKIIDVPKLDVPVLKGPVLDGIDIHLKDTLIKISNEKEVDVAQALKDYGAEIAICYLPTGAVKAANYYAEQALKAGVAFVNAMPAPIASDETWQKKFMEANVPLAGDDVQNQVGATVVHKTLINLIDLRGARVENTYQINIGGTPDFANLEYRKEGKEKTKTRAVKQMASHDFQAFIAPVAYIKFLGCKKIAHMVIEGRKFAGVPFRIELMLEVYDPYNSAGMMVDVIRLVKLALDRGIGGPLISISAWAFKNPPVHAPPYIAKQWVIEFIEGKRER